MIIPVSMALIAVFLGYVVVVGCSLGATLALASTVPQFVEADFCLRSRYKAVQAMAWLLFTAAGGYAAALIGDHGWALINGVALVGLLIAVLWQNTWEARQGGLAHQILLTAVTPVGVLAGYLLLS